MNAPQTADPFGLVGQVLDGQFRVEKLVGEGGFSAVYRGHHLGLNEPVAIKALKLPPSLGSQLVDNFVHRFRDESRILYRLSQGNLHIVRSIAAGTTKTTTSGLVVPYMVLEWLEGRSLANDFTVRKTLGNPGRSLDELVTLFATAADALAFAHAQGVVHRDLNPGNFFLAVTPQGMKMKVLDFGVAKILDDSTLNLGPRAQTMGQIRIFAPAYGSPEQFDDGLGAVAPPSDVYAFALILMEALRDRPVNEGHNLSDFATAAVDANRRPTPKSLGLDVPEAVQQVFERATKLRPAERYPHVGEMWRAFEAAVTASRGAKKSDRPAAPARPAAGPLGRTLPLGSPHMPGIPLPSAAGPGGLKPPPGRSAGTTPLGSSAQKAAAAAAAMSKPTPAPLPKPTPSPAAIPAPPPKKPAPSPMDTAKTKVSPSPAAGAVTVMGVGSGPSTQRFAPRPAAKTPSEPPLHGGDDDGEDEPTRVGNSPLGGAAMPSEPPLHDEPRDEVTRVHAPDADVLMAASSIAKTVMGTPPPGQQRRPSPIPPAPPSGATLAIPPGGGGLPIPAPPNAFVPSATPQQPPTPTPAPPPGQRLSSLEHTIALGATSPYAPQPGQGSLPPYPSQPMPQPPSGNMPAAPAPGPASAMGPAPGMTPPGMMPGGGLPAHFAQAQQPPQFSYPTGAHPQPGFADASAQPKPQQPGAPVGLIIGAVALLIVALGGFALFILFGRSSGASTGTASSASASAQPVASPVPAPSPTPPPIATPTETQAANEPPPPDSASAAPSNEPPPTPTTTTTTPTPTPTATTTTVATGGNTWTPPTATAVPKPTPTAAPEPVDPRAWNESAARARLSQANGAMAFCRQADNPGGAGSATVTFAPEGNVASVALDPPYAGTKTGDCVAGQFKRAKLNPFDGPSRTLKHSFEVPK